ncbi:MAG: MBL fold metallo-hydrolase [Candidatus Altiarchaeota archaeon]
MHKITFLGTAGGRFVILTQRRYSGGIWLEFDNVTISLDPGPGALIRALQFGKSPQKLNAIFVSHNHLDHYNDAEVLIEAMTYGMKKNRGIFATNEETLPYISEYHKKAVEVLSLKPNSKFNIKNLKIVALPTYRHSNAIGFKFFTEKGIVTYSADTAYSEELVQYYQNSKILILNVIFPYSKEIETHLNTKNAIKLIKEANPEVAIITHFGMQFLNSSPEKEAKLIEENSGIRTIAARDGLSIDLEKFKSKESEQLKLI